MVWEKEKGHKAVGPFTHGKKTPMKSAERQRRTPKPWPKKVVPFADRGKRRAETPGEKKV